MSSRGVKCWGANWRSEVVYTVPYVIYPVPTDIVGVTDWVASVSAGEYHACAVTTSGGVKCWGYNGNGRLGDQTIIDSLVAVDVTGLTSGVASVSVGYNHTCVVMTSGGAKCWGANSNGQLGNNRNTDSQVPVDVVGLTEGLASISAGNTHTCAVTTAGGAKCWGYNFYGAIGDGTKITRYAPVNVQGLTSGVVSISVGMYHTCALTSTGGVKCWGANDTGQLGNGTRTPSLIPVDVPGLTAGVARVDVGKYHACATMTSGGVKCWGDSWSAGSVPMDVAGLPLGVASVSTGGAHTCVVTTTGAAHCWGNNDYGQLGDNKEGQSSSVPVEVKIP